MDKGQPIQPAGAGMPLEDTNIFAEKYNLDTSSEGAASWENSVERNPGNTGKNVLNSFGNTDSTKEELNPSIIEELPKTPEQVQDPLMPPGAINPDILQPENQLPPEQFDKAAIKTEEKLSKSGIREVDEVLTKFKQDNNPSGFYDSVRNMMEANLDNSYNRKLGA